MYFVDVSLCISVVIEHLFYLSNSYLFIYFYFICAGTSVSVSVSPADDLRTRLRYPFLSLSLPLTPLSVYLSASPFLSKSLSVQLHDFVMKWQYDALFKAAFAQSLSVLYPLLLYYFNSLFLGTRAETILRNSVQIFTAQSMVFTVSVSVSDDRERQTEREEEDDEEEEEREDVKVVRERRLKRMSRIKVKGNNVISYCLFINYYLLCIY